MFALLNNRLQQLFAAVRMDLYQWNAHRQLYFLSFLNNLNVAGTLSDDSEARRHRRPGPILGSCRSAPPESPTASPRGVGLWHAVLDYPFGGLQTPHAHPISVPAGAIGIPPLRGRRVHNSHAEPLTDFGLQGYLNHEAHSCRTNTLVSILPVSPASISFSLLRVSTLLCTLAMGMLLVGVIRTPPDVQTSTDASTACLRLRLLSRL